MLEPEHQTGRLLSKNKMVKLFAVDSHDFIVPCNLSVRFDNQIYGTLNYIGY
jgi:hypothetical protein